MSRYAHPSAPLRSRTRPLLALVCATLVATTALSGCKSGSGEASKSKDSVASLGTAPKADKSGDKSGDDSGKSSGDNGDDTTDSNTMSPEDAMKLYNACMSDAGFPDIFMMDGSSGGLVDEASSSASDAGTAPFDEEAFNEADAECSKHLEGVFPSMDDFSPEQQAVMEDAAASYEKCMADKGFPIHVSFGGPGEGLPAEENSTEAQELSDKMAQDPEAFEAADKECSKSLMENATLNDIMSSDGSSG